MSAALLVRRTMEARAWNDQLIREQLRTGNKPISTKRSVQLTPPVRRSPIHLKKTLADIPEDHSCRVWRVTDDDDSSSSSTTATSSTSSTSSSSSQDAMIMNASKRDLAATKKCYELINEERQKRQLLPLNRSEKLHRLARLHAKKMATAGKLSHSVKDFRELQELLQSKDVGENIQQGWTPAGMHKETMKGGPQFTISKDNILSADFSEYGVAAARGKLGKLYICYYFR